MFLAFSLARTSLASGLLLEAFILLLFLRILWSDCELLLPRYYESDLRTPDRPQFDYSMVECALRPYYLVFRVLVLTSAFRGCENSQFSYQVGRYSHFFPLVSLSLFIGLHRTGKQNVQLIEICCGDWDWWLKTLFQLLGPQFPLSFGVSNLSVIGSLSIETFFALSYYWRMRPGIFNNLQKVPESLSRPSLPHFFPSNFIEKVFQWD